MPRKEISYDPVDATLDQAKLEAKYAEQGSHPEFTLAKWKAKLSKFPELEAQFNGYWDWVVTMIDSDFNEAPEAGTAQTVNVTESDMIDIETIDQFAQYIGQWHHNKIAVLRHMQSIPAGTEMEVAIGDKTATVKLEGEVMTGFQAGIELALIEISNLPFVASTETMATKPELKLVHDAADPSQG